MGVFSTQNIGEDPDDLYILGSFQYYPIYTSYNAALDFIEENYGEYEARIKNIRGDLFKYTHNVINEIKDDIETKRYLMDEREKIYVDEVVKDLEFYQKFMHVKNVDLLRKFYVKMYEFFRNESWDLWSAMRFTIGIGADIVVKDDNDPLVESVEELLRKKLKEVKPFFHPSLDNIIDGINMCLMAKALKIPHKDIPIVFGDYDYIRRNRWEINQRLN